MVVPADWKEVKVADVIVDSFSGPSPTCLERNIQGEEWGVFKTTCSTTEQGWDYTKHKVLPRAFWGMTRSLIEVGDTVITKAGPRHRVGVASYVNRTLDRLIVSGKMIGLRPNKTVVCPPFLALALSSKPTQEFLNQRTTGMAESQVNFENVALLETPLYFPPLKEQEVIAEALSDADAAIESLDVLIAKKRDVKQATMQQLLTGRTRLPGFTADWKEVRLGELGSFSKGAGIKKDDVVSTGVPCVRYGQLYTEHDSVIRSVRSFVSTEVASTSRPLVVGEILFAGSGETKAEIGKCVAYVDGIGAVAGGDLVILTPKQCSSIFLGYALNSPEVVRQKMARAQGDAVVHISAASLATVVVGLPSLKEQEAIAEALTVMDDELEALTQQVSKLRMVKEGMMQDLLTGKVRLV